MTSSKGKYYKDNPETKRKQNATRRTTVCSDGVKRVVYPSHPDYPGERVLKPTKQIDPLIAKLRAEDKAIYEASDNKQSLLKHGFVYVISNPAWQEWVKVGHSRDPERRLSSYNTGCPDRDYTLNGYVYFENRIEAEQTIHQSLEDGNFSRKGEWFNCPTQYVLTKLGDLDEALNSGHRDNGTKEPESRTCPHSRDEEPRDWVQEELQLSTDTD